MATYNTHGFNLNQRQLKQLKGSTNGATLTLRPSNLSGGHKLMLPQSSINRVRKAQMNGKGLRLKISATAMRKNRQGNGFFQDLSKGLKDVNNVISTINPLKRRDRRIEDIWENPQQFVRGRGVKRGGKQGGAFPIALAASIASQAAGPVLKMLENSPEFEDRFQKRLRFLRGNGVNMKELGEDIARTMSKPNGMSGSGLSGDGAFSDFMQGFKRGLNPLKFFENIELIGSEIEHALKGKGVYTSTGQGVYSSTGQGVYSSTGQGQSGQGIVFL